METPYYFVYLSFFLILTDTVRCDADYSFNFEADGWFKLHKTPQTWKEAFDTCYDEGAVLASPLNIGFGVELKSQMAQSGVIGHIFLGIHDFLANGVFTSIEGVQLSDMDIRWGSHGNGSDTGDCLTMSSDGSVYYSLCNTSLPFICYKKMNKCGTLDEKYQHNQKTGSCYKIHNDKTTWSRAYSICASEGAHLVILNDAEEARIVKGMFPARTGQFEKFDGFHIGLVALGKKRNWITIQGERIDNVFNEWLAGEPDNYQGSQDRGVYVWQGNLDDIHKDLNLRTFACEKSPKPEKYEDLSECNVKYNV